MNDDDMSRAAQDAMIGLQALTSKPPFTPSDAVPPDEPAAEMACDNCEHRWTGSGDVCPGCGSDEAYILNKEDLALEVDYRAYRAAVSEAEQLRAELAKRADELRAAEERAQEEVKAVALALARKAAECGRLHRMLQALTLPEGVGEAASLAVCQLPDGSAEYILTAPTLDEERLVVSFVHALRNVDAEVSAARTEGYRTAISEASAAAFDVDQVDTEHAPTLLGLVHEAMGAGWTHPDDLVDRMRARRDAADEAERTAMLVSQIERLRRELAALEKP